MTVKLEDLSVEDREALLAEARQETASEGVVDGPVVEARYKCPGSRDEMTDEIVPCEDNYRSFTLADVCPRHGVNVV